MTGILETIAISAAISLISAGITYALTPTQTIEGQRLADLTTAKSNYGVPLPWTWGTVRVGGNLVWSAFLEETKKKEKQGKGAKVETETYKYYGSFAHLFTECPFRPIVEIPRLWYNKKLVYSTVGGAETITEGGVFADRYLRFYKGSSLQDIDPLLAFTEPISNYNYGVPAGKANRDAFLTSVGRDPERTVVTPGYNNRAYVVAQRLPLEDFYNRIPSIEAEIVNEPATVGQILRDIFGLFFEPEQYDTSLVDNIPVDGFFINSIEAAKNVIQTLQQAYFFDIVQSGDQIKFVPLDHPRNTINLLAEDLAAHKSGSEKPLDYEISTQDTTALPSQVKVSYIDKNLNYDQNEQTSSLEVRKNYNPNITNLSFNIVMSADEAATIADKAMFLAWLQNKTYKFTLPPAYLDLEVADLLPNLFDESTTSVKITQARTGVDFSRQIEAVPYETSFLSLGRSLVSGGLTTGVSDYNIAIATDGIPTTVTDTSGTTYVEGVDYTVSGNSIQATSGGSIANGTDLIISTEATPTQSETEAGSIVSAGPTDLEILDIPLITNSDSDHTVYLTGGGGENWSGASIYISTDNLRFLFATTLDTYGIYGECTTTLASSGGVTVEVNQALLETVTDNDLLIGYNLALIGEEIIQYKFAELIGVNTYELSELTRGLRGTENFIDGHQPNERFVLLQGSNAALSKVIAEDIDINQIRYFKALSAGQTLDDVTAVAFNYQAISQRPYAPENLTATKNAAGDITIFWERRDRHDQNENPQLSESVEDYRLEFLDNSSGLLASVQTNDSFYFYSTADQVNDYSSIQSTIFVRIAQVGAIYGVGSYTQDTALTPVLVNPTPTITSFAPGSGLIGETITVTGTDLLTASLIKVGDITQNSLTVIDNQTASFEIAPGTVSGLIDLLTPGGTASSSSALIIAMLQTASGFPIANKLLNPPYLIQPSDYNTEIICVSGGVIKIPDLATNFDDFWGCWVSLNGTGIVTFERGTGAGNTSTIIQSSSLIDNGTVKLWHRGGNVWKID